MGSYWTSSRAAGEAFRLSPGVLPSIQRMKLPVIYVSEPRLTSSADWSQLLVPGPMSIRGKEFDAVLLSCWFDKEDEALLDAGFDGAFSDPAANGASYGSTARNWPRMAESAMKRGALFIPSVAPGFNAIKYDPTTIIAPREGGNYFSKMFSAAVWCLQRSSAFLPGISAKDVRLSGNDSQTRTKRQRHLQRVAHACARRSDNPLPRRYLPTCMFLSFVFSFFPPCPLLLLALLFYKLPPALAAPLVPLLSPSFSHIFSAFSLSLFLSLLFSPLLSFPSRCPSPSPFLPR